MMQQIEKAVRTAPYLSRREGCYLQAAVRDLDIVVEPRDSALSLTISGRFGNIDEHVHVMLQGKRSHVVSWSTFADDYRKVAHGVMLLPGRLGMIIDVLENDANYAVFYPALKDFYLRETKPRVTN